MSIYKTCSVQKVIAQIYRDFKPSNSGWVDDAIEWIADAISIMKVCQSFSTQRKKINVVDYRAKLPCDIEVLLGIEYKGTKLTGNGGIKNPGKKYSCECDDPNKCTCFNSYVCHGSESYTLNPNYINTSFRKGELVVYYQGIEVDCDGFPFVIDDPIYREALMWYILSKMALRGFKHQTIDYNIANQNWEKFYPKAQNRFRLADIDAYDSFMQSWMGLVKPNNLTNTFFNTSNPEYLSNPAIDPGTKFENYPFLD